MIKVSIVGKNFMLMRLQEKLLKCAVKGVNSRKRPQLKANQIDKRSHSQMPILTDSFLKSVMVSISLFIQAEGNC